MANGGLAIMFNIGSSYSITESSLNIEALTAKRRVNTIGLPGVAFQADDYKDLFS